LNKDEINEMENILHHGNSREKKKFLKFTEIGEKKKKRRIVLEVNE